MTNERAAICKHYDPVLLNAEGVKKKKEKCHFWGNFFVAYAIINGKSSLLAHYPCMKKNEKHPDHVKNQKQSN